MSRIADQFEERNNEIVTYLDFLDGLDAIIRSGVPRLGGDTGHVVTVPQQRILYSTVYLQLYNLIEATITNCFDEISVATMDGGVWGPNDLTTELRNEWVKQMAHTNVEMGAEKRLKRAMELCDHLLASLPIAPFSIEKGGGGNWDDEQIVKVSRRIGFNLRVSAEANSSVKRKVRNELGAMQLIVSMRNKLAHGSLSFVDCGQYDTPRDLRVLAERVAQYMREVVEGFEGYIANYEFVRPECRPDRAA